MFKAKAFRLEVCDCLLFLFQIVFSNCVPWNNSVLGGADRFFCLRGDGVQWLDEFEKRCVFSLAVADKSSLHQIS